MGGQPAAINGTRFGSKEKQRGGEMGSQGGGGVAAPFHYGGGGTAARRRAGRGELRSVGDGGWALP
jgi:hypothetical protein